MRNECLIFILGCHINFFSPMFLLLNQELLCPMSAGEIALFHAYLTCMSVQPSFLPTKMSLVIMPVHKNDAALFCF